MISIRLLGYGERVNTLRDVEESVTIYAARATDKLRSQALHVARSTSSSKQTDSKLMSCLVTAQRKTKYIVELTNS